MFWLHYIVERFRCKWRKLTFLCKIIKFKIVLQEGSRMIRINTNVLLNTFHQLEIFSFFFLIRYVRVLNTCASISFTKKKKACTVPERSTIPLERWAHAKRMVNEYCLLAEWTVCECRTEFGERYVNGNGKQTQNANGAKTRVQNERWTNGERKMQTQAQSGARTVNTRWTIFSESFVCFLIP